MEKWEYLEQFRQISLQLGESFWESEVSQVEEFGRYLVRLQKQICEKGNMQKKKNVKGKLPLKWVWNCDCYSVALWECYGVGRFGLLFSVQYTKYPAPISIILTGYLYLFWGKMKEY